MPCPPLDVPPATPETIPRRILAGPPAPPPQLSRRPGSSRAPSAFAPPRPRPRPPPRRLAPPAAMHLLLAAARGTTDVAHVRSVGALVARAGVSLGRALRPRVRGAARRSCLRRRRRAAYSSAAAAAEIRGSTATDHARNLRSDALRLLRRAPPASSPEHAPPSAMDPPSRDPSEPPPSEPPPSLKVRAALRRPKESGTRSGVRHHAATRSTFPVSQIAVSVGPARRRAVEGGVSTVAVRPVAAFSSDARSDAVRPRSRAAVSVPHISAMSSSRNAAAPSTPDASMDRCRPGGGDRLRVFGDEEHDAAQRGVFRRDLNGVARGSRRFFHLLVTGLLPRDAEERAPRTDRSPRCLSGERLERALDAPHRLFASGVSLGRGKRAPRCALCFCTINEWKIPWWPDGAHGHGGASRMPVTP